MIINIGDEHSLSAIMIQTTGEVVRGIRVPQARFDPSFPQLSVCDHEQFIFLCTLASLAESLRTDPLLF